MRIRQLDVRFWRHFENLSLRLEDDANLVCVVGANGTGKSHLLELVAAFAAKLGVAQGFEAQRGDPFVDLHDLSIEIQISLEGWNCPVLMDTFSNPRKRGMRCRDGREEEAQTS